MPLLWGTTRCTQVAGWEDRIMTKLTVAGGLGAAVGSVLSVVQQRPLVGFTAASVASFLMLTGCYSVVQETSRLVRCRDSPTNSVLAGAATGTLLYKSHGRPAAPGAVVCAMLGGAAHVLSDKIDAAGGFQQFLIALDLLDPPPQSAATAAATATAAAAVMPEAHLVQQQQQGQQHAGGLGSTAAAAGGDQQEQQQQAQEGQEQEGQPRRWWHDYMPIRKMSDSEWEAYKSQQTDVQRKRIEAALAGGLPVMVDRQQQQQQGAAAAPADQQAKR